MITCLKSVTMDVTGVGCVDDGSPTPTTLVEPGDGPMGTVVLASPIIQQIGSFRIGESFSPAFPMTAGLGRYIVNYLGGHFHWDVIDQFFGTEYDIISTGGHTLDIVGGSDVSGLYGSHGYCSEQECTDALEAATFAQNPVTRNFDLSFPFFLGTNASLGYVNIIDPLATVSLRAHAFVGIPIADWLGQDDAFVVGSGDGSIGYALNQIEKFPLYVKRCRIKDYASSVAPLWVGGGTCPEFEDGTGLQEWDGTFPQPRVIYPVLSSHDRTLEYYQAGDLFQFGAPPVAPPVYSINGKSMVWGFFLVSRLSYRSVSGTAWWQLDINMRDSTGDEVGMWQGKKFTGKTPVGLYDYSGQCRAEPATVCVEAY